MKLFGIATILILASVGCTSTPVTFAPYVGYGGYDGGNYGTNNTWQVGIGASFTLGGSREYVTPVPGHPSLPVAPAQINVNNSNTNSASQSQNHSTGYHDHHHNHND